jgi:outer membrane lipase/esterase
MLLRILLTIVCAGFAASGAPFTSLYFFGDSLTDTGNVYSGTTVLSRYTLGAVPRHPTAPYAEGRFTNGPVWAEHVAAHLDRPQDALPGGMSMGWFGRLGGSGNNYAVGGARTDSGGALGLLDIALPTGIFEQVDFYLSKTGGIADPGGLYFVFGAGNDLRDAARIADPNERMQASQQAGINLAYSVQRLYFAGARQFVLINSPDVGLIPESIGDGVTAAGTDASVQFNTWLGLYAAYLPTVPEFSLHFFDLFGLHHELIAQRGFEAIRPCKNGPAELCEQTLFFDSIHPTAWVHEIIGARIADQLLGASSAAYLSSAAAEQVHAPEPSTIVLILSAAAALFVVRRKASFKMKDDAR